MTRMSVITRLLGAILLRSVIALGLLVMCLTPLSYVAAQDINQNNALELRKQGKILGLSKLLLTINTQYPNFTLLEAELKELESHYLYQIVFLTQKGMTREVTIDASNGEIMNDRSM